MFDDRDIKAPLNSLQVLGLLSLSVLTSSCKNNPASEDPSPVKAESPVSRVIATGIDAESDLALEITDDGTFFLAPHGAPRIPIGAVDEAGDYQLKGGETGSIFESTRYSFLHFEVGTSLQKEAVTFAQENSEIPFVHHQVNERGHGVTVVHIATANSHKDLVNSVLSDEKFGIAPLAHVRTQIIAEAEKHTNTLNEFIAENVLVSFRAVIEELKNIARSRSTGPRVVVMALSSSIADIAEKLVEPLDDPSAAVPRRSVYGNNVPSATAEKVRRIAHYVERVLESDKEVQKIRTEYVNATKTLADQNSIMVVSLGEEMNYPRELRAPYRFNLFALSPYVISVGGSNSAGTPGNYSDDLSYALAAGGGTLFGKAVAPTLIAPSTSIAVRFNNVVNSAEGTSFGAPYVAGTIACIYEVNPHMSWEEVTQCLVHTARHLNHLPPEIQGAGEVDAVSAIKFAKQHSGRHFHGRS